MLKAERVKESVDALMKIVENREKDVLLDHPDAICVQFTLKQIQTGKNQKIHIKLPHSLHYDTREVCLFVKDLDHKDKKQDREYEPTVQFYQDLFKQKNVKNITKIVPMKALRTDYSMFSDKRSLSKAYDLYLADECVMGCLPGLLGKIFYQKTKTRPVAVNLSLKDLDKEIDRVVDNALILLQGKGSTSTVCIGNDRMTRECLVDNITATFNTLCEKVPGGIENLKNVYIKSSDSLAIPLYINLNSPNAVNLPAVKKEEIPEFVDEISTVDNARIKVRADGRLKILADKEEKTDEDNSAEVTKDEKLKKTKTKGKAGNKRKAQSNDGEVVVEKKKMRDSLSDGDDGESSDDKPATPKQDGQGKKKKRVRNKKNKKSEESVSVAQVVQKNDEKLSEPKDDETKNAGQTNKKGKQNNKKVNESVSKVVDVTSNDEVTPQKGEKGKKNRKRKGKNSGKDDDSVGNKKIKENKKEEPKVASNSENIKKSNVKNENEYSKPGKQQKIDKKPLASKQNESKGSPTTNNGSPATNKKSKQTGGGKKKRSKKA